MQKKQKELEKKIKNNKGFVLLFAVTISSILLSIALGVANVSFKELRFGTSARDANDAFFAADAGVECALYHDRSVANQNAFTGTSSMNCAGSSITILGGAPTWTFVVPSLGSLNQSCAKVTVYKDPTTQATTITSKGYNVGDASCASSSTNRAERELKVFY